MPKESEAQPGTVIGSRYRVERLLGRGGVGFVVVARDLQLKRVVAIKLLRDDQSPEAVARFVREANAVVQLTGEHCVRVHDVGRLDEGAPFIVMEYLEGRDLHVVWREHGRLPSEQAVDWILEACEGVAEAHARGIVHRDLKLGNLFLANRPNGTTIVKVLDFGLAKTYGEDQRITASDKIIGSPQYMSPEQVRATHSVDLRTDVWALGVCLYELVTGAAPFPGKSGADILVKILSDAPALASSIHSDIPEALAAAIDRCLKKEPSDRFPNVGEMAAALEPFGTRTGAADRVRTVLRSSAPVSSDTIRTVDTSGPSVQTIHFPPPRRRRAIWIASGVLLALAIAAGVMHVRSDHPPTQPPSVMPPAPSSVAPIETSPATPPPTSSASPSIAKPPSIARPKPAPSAKRDAGPSERF